MPESAENTTLTHMISNQSSTDLSKVTQTSSRGNHLDKGGKQTNKRKITQKNKDLLTSGMRVTWLTRSSSINLNRKEYQLEQERVITMQSICHTQVNHD